MDTNFELRALASEYKSYFPECVLHLDSQPGYIQITTEEGKHLKVGVSQAGWHILGTNTYFQTFEALLNRESPGFSRSFANSLSAKLSALAER